MRRGRIDEPEAQSAAVVLPVAHEPDPDAGFWLGDFAVRFALAADLAGRPAGTRPASHRTGLGSAVHLDLRVQVDRAR